MRWFVSQDEYLARFPPITVEDPAAVYVVPSVIPNGPNSRVLARLLAPRVSSHLTLSRIEDHGTDQVSMGSVEYLAASGAGLSAMRQRLIRPLPCGVLGGLGPGGRLMIWETGSELALVARAPDSFLQIIMVRPGGTMLNLNSFGLSGKGVPPPLSISELETLVRALDTTDLDC